MIGFGVHRCAAVWVRYGVPAVALALFLGGQAASGQAVAVSGTDRALIVPPSGAVITEYQNFGYALKFRQGGIEIQTQATPFSSGTRFAPPIHGPHDGPIEELAFRLTAGARSRYEAVSRLLNWMGGNVRYDLTRGPSQEAEAVLARRSGYCTGVARLAVALLRAVEIPAREVPGYVVADSKEESVTEGYHRWIEVHYDDLGWIFSDPLATHHWVPANYVRLDREELVGGGTHQNADLLRRQNEIRGEYPLWGLATGIQVRGSRAWSRDAALELPSGARVDRF